MQTIQVISDIHAESYKDAGEAFIQALPVTAPILVIAGDIACIEVLPLVLHWFCAKWEQVVVVMGNHDYGKVGRDGRSGLHRMMSRGVEVHTNLHWLNNSTVVVGGIKFVGGTLWFPDDPLNELYSAGMWDFQNIPDFRRWVYQEARFCVEALHAAVDTKTVVVTHHLPSPLSIAPEYKHSPLNQFFLHDQTDLILDRQPQLWIHGHTHSSLDYHLDKTRVLCNPSGYGFQSNRGFDKGLTVKVGATTRCSTL